MKAGRIIGVIAVISLFVFRMYNAKQQEKKRKQKIQMIDDLSRQQAEERAAQDAKRIESYIKETSDSMKNALQETKDKMDSMRISLEDAQKKFNKSIESIEIK